MALPAGPTTLAKVKARLGIAEADEANDLEIVDHVDAVNELVNPIPIAADHDLALAAHVAAVTQLPNAPRIVAGLAEDAVAHPSRAVLGATMLAFRIYRRRNSASGIEAFGSDGAVYTQRNDPDIAQLLGLGA